MADTTSSSDSLTSRSLFLDGTIYEKADTSTANLSLTGYIDTMDTTEVANPDLDQTVTIEESDVILDKDWVGTRFGSRLEYLEQYDWNLIYSSPTMWKFGSTKLGCSLVSNPKPQFTRTCDIRGNSRLDGFDAKQSAKFVPNIINYNIDSKANIGLGRYYSEAIEDSATILYFTFGIPKFNSLLDFFSKALSWEDAYIANTGKIPIGYTVGTIAASLITFIAFPLISVTIWALKLIGKIFESPYSYYYLKPAMHSYWGTVNTILTDIVTEMGWLPADLMSSSTDAKRYGNVIQMDKNELIALSKLMPDIINPDTGYIDVYRIAAKFQIAAIEIQNKIYDTYKNLDSGEISMDMTGYITSDGVPEGFRPYMLYGTGIFTDIDKKIQFSNLVDLYLHKSTDQASDADPLYGGTAPSINIGSTVKGDDKDADGSENTSNAINNAVNKDGTLKTENTYSADRKDVSNPELYGTVDIGKIDNEGFLEKAAKALDATLRDGVGWAIFEVDYPGSGSESISSSYSDIETSGMQRGASQAARNMKFDLAGGNLVGGVDTLISAATGVLMGALNGVTFGLSNIIYSLLGGGYIKMPKKWDDSEFSKSSTSYTMHLRSPYGTPFSLIKNIYYPLSMILAGALPLATGKSSYTSPFLCSLFSKGMENIRLGMITSVSINRAVDNLPYSRNFTPLGIDVSFTVTDFSPLVAAPINASLWDKTIGNTLLDDTELGSYIATLVGRDIQTQKYNLPKIKRRFARSIMAINQAFSPSGAGEWVGEIGILYNVISPLTSRKWFAQTQLNTSQTPYSN